MALEFVGQTSGTGTGASYDISLSGTLTGGIASSPAAGDIVIVVSAAGGSSLNAPTVTGNSFGIYTEIQTAYVNDSWDTNLTVCFAVMQGTPDTQITATRTSSASYGGGTIVLVWRGQNTTAFNQIYPVVTITNASRATPANATPTVADSQIIVLGAGTQGTSGSAFTVPAALTGGSVSIKSDGSTSDVGVYAGWVSGTQNSTTVINAPTGGATSTSSSGAAVTLVLTSSPPSTRYWVGGTATWDTTNTAVWSTSSGGAGGASVPGVGDNAVFDTGGGTITCTGALVCNNITSSTGSYTFINGTSPTFTIYGSMNLYISGWSATGQITFRNFSPSINHTIYSNAQINSPVDIKSDAYSSYSLNGAFNCGTTIFEVFSGIFNTLGYSLTAGTLQATGSVSAQINLSWSSIVLSDTTALNFTNPNLILNAGSSTITCTYTGSIAILFQSINKVHTFYNLTFSQWGSSNSLTEYIDFILEPNTTFYNLYFAAQRQGGTKFISFFGTTVNFTGYITFPYSGYGYRRLIILGGDRFRSSTITSDTLIRTTTTISMTSGQPNNLGDIDFFDINVTGSGSLPWSGTRLGDGGGNSNITFPAPKTVYYYSGANPTYWNATGGYGWGTGSGGSGVSSTNNFPLLQDTAVIDNNSFPSGTTLGVGWPFCLGKLDMSSRTLPVTFTTSTQYLVSMGGVLAGSGVTGDLGGYTSQGKINFVNLSSTVQVSFTGPSWKIPLIFQAGKLDGTYQGKVSLTQSSVVDTDIYLNTGELDLTNSGAGNYNLTITNSSLISSTVTRSINFGSGKIIFTGSNGGGISYWSFTNLTNFSLSGTPTIELNSSETVAAIINHGTGSGATEANAVSINIVSAPQNLSFNGYFKDINCSGYSNQLTMGGITIYGSLTLSSTQTLAASSSTVLFRGTSGTQDITTNGKTLDFPINVNGVGGTVRLLGTTTIGSTRLLTLTNGTLDLNGQTLNIGTFATATGTKNITFNGGTLNLSSSGATVWNNAVPSGFTTTAGTGTGKISLTSASAKTFVGGGSTYNCSLNQGGAGALTISGSNTFNDITNTTRPTTVTLASGTTQTVSNFSLSGINGSLVTINSSTAGNRATLSKNSGTVSLNYCSIRDNNATGSATWQAYLTNGNIDIGNNTGWIFYIPSGNFLNFFS